MVTVIQFHSLFITVGELLFKTENALQECWDGKQENGEYYPTGTYFGVAQVKHHEADKAENISVSITFIH